MDGMNYGIGEMRTIVEVSIAHSNMSQLRNDEFGWNSKDCYLGQEKVV